MSLSGQQYRSNDDLFPLVFFPSAYKDEPEDGEEASEEKENGLDTFSYSPQVLKKTTTDDTVESTTSSTQPPKKTIKKIDLGAAATLISVPQTSQSNTASSNTPLPVATSNLNGTQNQPSAVNDLADLMGSVPAEPPLMPTPASGGTDLFGTFSGVTTTGAYIKFFLLLNCSQDYEPRWCNGHSCIRWLVEGFGTGSRFISTAYLLAYFDWSPRWRRADSIHLHQFLGFRLQSDGPPSGHLVWCQIAVKLSRLTGFFDRGL